MNDLRFAFRQLLKNPGFTCVAVLTLALAIGANTALFSVVDAVLLRTFGYDDAARLIQIGGTNRQGQNVAVSISDLMAFRSRAQSIEKIAASKISTFTLLGAREPENIYGQIVSEDCFAVLGAASLM